MNTKVTPKVSSRLDGIGEYYFSKKNREIDDLRASGKDVISLGIGSPDLPPHESVVEALYRTAQRPDVHGYQSYRGAKVLREAFAQWYARYYGVELNSENELLPLIGSKEGIMHVSMTYLDKGDKVLIPSLGYPTYRSAARIAGGDITEYTLSEANGWMPDFDQLEELGRLSPKLMFVNYPNMPTGARPTREMFERLVEWAGRYNVLLVHDNPYSFIRNGQPMSLLSIDGAREVALEFNSLSKSHCMAGWRVGVIAGKAERIDEIMRFKSNMDSGMFLPVQQAAAAALSLGDDWYESINAIYRQREKAGYALLDTLGCTYDSDQSGLFIWAKLPADYKGDCFAFSDEILYGHDVFVTPGGIFGPDGNRFIRISLCATEQKLKTACERVAKRAK